MSKRIVRITESQLVDIVKRVINEQSAPLNQLGTQSPKKPGTIDPDYNKAWGIMNMLMEAIEGLGTNEPKILKAVQSIGTKKVYDYLLQIVQKSPKVKSETGRNYNTVMEYILEDFQIPMFDKPEKMMMARKNDPRWSDYEDTGYSKKTSTQIPKQCAEILSKFNQAELDAFADGLQFQHDYV